MANKKPAPADERISADWDDSWESEVALVEAPAAEALQELLPLAETEWAGGRFQVPADLAYGTLVRRGIQALATDHLMSPDDTADLVLAVSEAFNNAVRHGTSRSNDHVEFTARIADGLATIELRYRGEPFPTGRPELPAPSSPNGRGRYIMVMLMDEVRYRFDPPWTSVELVKRYRPFPTPELAARGT